MKPFRAKRKLLSGILDCADAAMEKLEGLSTDVKQYQRDKPEQESGNIGGVEAVNPTKLARVAEPGFQYGAEAFEAYKRGHSEEKADRKPMLWVWFLRTDYANP